MTVYYLGGLSFQGQTMAILAGALGALSQVDLIFPQFNKAARSIYIFSISAGAYANAYL